jgi:hypothetical protein
MYSVLYNVHVPAWKEKKPPVAPQSFNVVAGLGNKKISLPLSPHHSSYNKRRLFPRVESANWLVQCYSRLGYIYCVTEVRLGR